jgi:hypothetical protein
MSHPVFPSARTGNVFSLLQKPSRVQMHSMLVLQREAKERVRAWRGFKWFRDQIVAETGYSTELVTSVMRPPRK